MSSSTRFKFTTTKINKLNANKVDAKSTELELSDTEIIGLKLLVGKSANSKRFLLRYTSPITKRKASISLGRWPDLSIDMVRKRARELKADIASGIDPKLERDTQVTNAIPTVFEFFHETYLPLAKKKKITWNDDVARFKHCAALFDLPFDKLTANHLLQLQLSLTDKKGRYSRRVLAVGTVNRVIALMKTVCKLAYRLLDIPNVGDKVSLFAEDNVRTRYLSLEETTKVIEAARRYHCVSSGNLIAMLFLTGCRVSELRLRLWSDLDIEQRTLVIPRTKNGSSHTVYLDNLMIEIITAIPKQKGNPYIFAGHKYGRPITSPRIPFKHIKAEVGLVNPNEVVLHSARHTYCSLLVSNSVPITEIQKLVNHQDLSSTLRYSKLSESKHREAASYLSNMVTACGEQRHQLT